MKIRVFVNKFSISQKLCISTRYGFYLLPTEDGVWRDPTLFNFYYKWYSYLMIFCNIPDLKLPQWNIKIIFVSLNCMLAIISYLLINFSVNSLCNRNLILIKHLIKIQYAIIIGFIQILVFITLWNLKICIFQISKWRQTMNLKFEFIKILYICY